MGINVKKLLAEALTGLCGEMPLQKITVKDICAKAGTVRQTFYNHFIDKNDLIYWIFLQTVANEQYYIEEKQDYYAYLRSIYRKGQEQREFFTQACKLEGQNSLTEAIFWQTFKYYRKYIIRHVGAGVLTEELEFALRFNAHGAASMYVHWAEQGMPGSADAQARYALACMPYCVKQYLPIRSGSLEAG